MQRPSLRSELRQHTEAVHRSLDTLVGPFDGLASYGAFLVNTYRFRQMVEPALASGLSWSPQYLLPELRLDLEDLQLRPEAGPVPAHELPDEAARVGALYVLEGSALGARVLLQRAIVLGLGAGRGARHLAKQAADPSRWRDFLGFLEQRQDLDRSATLAAAHSIFDTAIAIYSGGRNDNPVQPAEPDQL